MGWAVRFLHAQSKRDKECVMGLLLSQGWRVFGAWRTAASVMALALIIAALPLQHAQAQRFRLTVGGAHFRPYPLAIPDLADVGSAPDSAGTQKLANELTLLMREYVDLVRPVELVPVKTYLAPEKESWNNPTYANWVNVGASGLIRGTVAVSATNPGNAHLVLRFFDVTGQRELLHRAYDVPRGQAANSIRQFLDEVIQVLTGEPGILSSKIAYVKRTPTGRVIVTADMDGRHPNTLTDPKQLSLLPAWDNSGRYVLMTSFLQGNADLYRLNVLTKAQDRISNKEGLNTGAAVSPDGKKVALTLSVDGNTEIYVMDWDGKNLRRLTDNWGEDVSPSWSPDGNQIAFVSSRSGNPHIYVMNADGSGARRLTFQGKYNQEPDWSPRADGQIAFSARDERLKFDIFLVHPRTGQITRLTQDDGHNEGPSHSPDGHQIVFTSTRAGSEGRGVYVMDVDGNNQRRISRESGYMETPSWGPRMPYAAP